MDYTRFKNIWPYLLINRTPLPKYGDWYQDGVYISKSGIPVRVNASIVNGKEYTRLTAIKDNWQTVVSYNRVFSKQGIMRKCHELIKQSQIINHKS